MASNFNKIFDRYKTYDTSQGFGNSSQWQDAFEQRMNFKVLNNEEKQRYKDIVNCMYDTKTEAELKTLYRKLMMQYHPDRNGDTEENKTITQRISDVYFEIKEKENYK